MAKKKTRLVEVTWIDSAFNQGWKQPKTFVPLSKCKTVGYLTHDAKDCINVSMNITKDGSYGDTMTIPRVCVRKIRTVR